jgi:hypothetical protein
MGADGAIDCTCASVAERLSRTPERCSSSRYIVDQKQVSPFGPILRRKTPLRQLETTGPGVAGLAAKTVPSQESNHRGFYSPGN